MQRDFFETKSMKVNVRNSSSTKRVKYSAANAVKNM